MNGFQGEDDATGFSLQIPVKYFLFKYYPIDFKTITKSILHG